MKTLSVLNKCKTILSNTDDFTNFESLYPENLRMHGDRVMDAAIFIFNIEDEYKLVVSFSEGEFDCFSILHNSINEENLNYFQNG